MMGFDSLKDVLDIVLVPVALALLVPWITRRWQETQRDSGIKTALIAEISELMMTMVMSVYMFNAGHAHQSRNSHILEDELNRIYKQWRVDTCVIGSKLHAYFPHTKNNCDMPIHEK